MPVVSGLGFAELAAGSPVMLFWVFSELLLGQDCSAQNGKCSGQQDGRNLHGSLPRVGPHNSDHARRFLFAAKLHLRPEAGVSARHHFTGQLTLQRWLRPVWPSGRVSIMSAPDSLVIVLSDGPDACRLSIGRDCLALALVAVLGTRVTSRRPRHNRPKG